MSGRPRATAPTAAVVVIGNEILSGRTRDANLSYLATKLGDAGVRTVEARVVPDIEERIVEAVNELRQNTTYVFTTGGIGPTHDDITARAIAVAFGRPFGRNAEAESRLRQYYDPEMLNEARLSMADMPEGAELIDNPVSVAPGFRLENVYVLPGVPKILQAMADVLVPALGGGAPIGSAAITVFAAEGEVAELLAAVQREHPEVDIGSYPFFRQGRFGTTVVARSADMDKVSVARRALEARFVGAGFDWTVFDAAADARPRR